MAKLGLQAARPQTSPGGAKPNAPLRTRVSKTDIPCVGRCGLHALQVPNAVAIRHRSRLQGMQPCSRYLQRVQTASSGSCCTRQELCGSSRRRTRRTLQQSTATLTQTLLDAQDTSRNLWEMLACWRTHTLVTRSSTQKVASPSSGEPEHCSTQRCANEAIGLANTMRELGHKAQVRMWLDAAGARWRWLSEEGKAPSNTW